MSTSIHSQVHFSPLLARIAKRDHIFRIISKIRATKNMTPGAKKSISSPMRRTSIGAKQHARAIALRKGQKNVKVDPVGYEAGDEDELPVRRIRWGTVDTRLVSYDIPFDISDDQENKKITTKTTTERLMKIEKIVEISNNLKSNLRDYYNDKQCV
jgi:hypothetical protein